MANRNGLSDLLRICYLLFAICYFSLSSSALAQPKPTKKPPPVEIQSIDFGWDQVIPGDRWSPVTVYITSQQNAFSGILTVEYDQDSTQETHLVTPIATTPGKVTPVELVVALPPMCQRLTFNIYDQSGRNPDRWEYTRDTMGDGLQMPHIGAGGGLIITLSDSTARLTVDRYQYSTPDGKPAGPNPSPAPPIYNYQPRSGPVDLWTQIQLSRINPDHVPMSWTAFEGIDLFIAKADDLMKTDARARAALLTWVEAGGRLLIQADAAGDWRTFLPGEDFITLDPLQKVKAGEELANILHKETEEDPATTTARLIHLTPTAISRGWTLSWPAAPMGSPAVPAGSDPADPNSGLKASGPFGLGIITILGVEPQALPQTIDPKLTRAIWRDAITPVLGPHAHHAAQVPSSTYYAYSPGYQDDDQTIQAIHAALDQSATVPPLGMGVFIAIAACMALLALMLGPIDAIALKHFRQSQRSWLTALLWISVASLAAYLAPRAMRSGETVAHRTSTIDVICDKDGLPLTTAHTAITGIFGGRPINVAIDGAPPGTFFRGVSSLEPYSDHSRSVFSPLILPLKVQQQDPFLLGTPPQPFSVSQWTFRGLLDQSPLHQAKATDIGAKVRERPDGSYDVTLINAPASLRDASATLHVGDQDFHVILQPHTQPDPTAKFNDLSAVTATTPDPAPPAPQAPPTTQYYGYPAPTPVMPIPATGISADTAAFLPGARDRTSAIESMLHSGRYACLTVRLTDLPMDIALNDIPSLQTQHTAYIRIVTPLEK
jgi:hypothetical protein